jgi:hypothetical protein
MRELRLVVVGLTVLAALLAAGVACGGGGGESEATPTSTATGVPASTATPVDTQVQQQLRQIVLPLEELPAGVTLAEEYFATNDESAAATSDPAGRLAKLEEWGRILGYEVTYQANPEVISQTGLILINSNASLYGSDEGASASFAEAAETARTTDWPAQFGGAQDVQVAEVPSPPLADEMVWLRITIKAEAAGLAEETFAQDVILFRQGPARGGLMVAWSMESGSSDFVQQLAEAQAQKMKEAFP